MTNRSFQQPELSYPNQSRLLCIELVSLLYQMPMKCLIFLNVFPIQNDIANILPKFILLVYDIQILCALTIYLTK